MYSCKYNWGQFSYICILILATLKMAKWAVDTCWWPQCDTITSIKPKRICWSLLAYATKTAFVQAGQPWCMRSYHSSACWLAGICPAVTRDLSRPADSSGRGQRQHGSSLSLSSLRGSEWGVISRRTSNHALLRTCPSYTNKRKIKVRMN